MFDKLDEREYLILSYVAMREPVTAYRIAVDNRLFFSYTYKKVVELERRGFLASAAASRGQRVYKATPMGIIALIQREGPRRYLVDKLASKWGLDGPRALALVEKVAKLYRPDMPLNDVELLYIYLAKRGLMDGELAAALSPVAERVKASLSVVCTSV